MEQGLHEQVVMIREASQKIKRKKKRQINTISKNNQQDQDILSILIMSGQKKNQDT